MQSNYDGQHRTPFYFPLQTLAHFALVGKLLALPALPRYMSFLQTFFAAL
jgi:hypothetical protein